MTEREQDEHLARLLAGEPLDDASRAALARAMESGDGAATDQWLLDRLLRHHFTNAGRGEFTGEVLARLEAPASGESELGGKVVRRLTWRRWRPALAAAACVALAGLLWLTLRPHEPEARLTASTAAHWMKGAEMADGAALHAGARLRLERGFVSVQFASGASLVLEGAADLEITGRNSAALHSGSAVASVPESAHGFTISSARGKVVDLGTEFAVRSSATGMEVHVLHGKVEAHPAGKPMLTLETDAAVRMDSTGAATIAQAADQFLTALPPGRSAAPAWLHWSLDEGQGLAVAATGTGLPLDAARGTLTSLPGSTNLPSWTAGVRGAGIEFHGRDDYIQTDYPGISGAGPRTVACWVRVPQDLTLEGYALVSWGAHQEFGDTWQMSINTDARDGPMGRLRIGTHNGHVIGLRDLRDGQWHHVAAVLYPGPQPDVSTHVLLYVDGTLEPAARKTVRRVQTDTVSSMAQRVAFGKNSAVRDAADTLHPQHTFRGCMDEITLSTTALSEADIRILMTRSMAALP